MPLNKETKPYIHQVCADTGCHLDNLKMISDWDG